MIVHRAGGKKSDRHIDTGQTLKHAQLRAQGGQQSGGGAYESQEEGEEAHEQRSGIVRAEEE